jgi:release factor glutamine methyltransferase
VSTPTAVCGSVGDLVSAGARTLAEAKIETPRFEAQLLASRVLGVGRADLLAHPERAVGEPERARYDELITRRARHEPTAYLVGERDFFGRPFYVDPRVLIPRPETELLVEAALAKSGGLSASRWIVDVGTGSGCVAITLALALPRTRVVASDLSWEALEVAHLNRERYGLANRVQLVQGDLLSWLPERRPIRSDGAAEGSEVLVVANLPYIPEETLEGLPADVREFEPRLALDGGPGGTRLVLRLLVQASRLGAGGVLAEVDERHATAVEAAARALFPDRALEVRPDLAGRPRLLRIGRAA